MHLWLYWIKTLNRRDTYDCAPLKTTSQPCMFFLDTHLCIPANWPGHKGLILSCTALSCGDTQLVERWASQRRAQRTFVRLDPTGDTAGLKLTVAMLWRFWPNSWRRNNNNNDDNNNNMMMMMTTLILMATMMWKVLIIIMLRLMVIDQHDTVSDQDTVYVHVQQLLIHANDSW